MLLGGCDPGGSDSSSGSSSSGTTTNGPYLYVSTGACYSGNNTAFSTTTSSNLVYRLSMATATREIVADYWAAPSLAGDSPTGIVNINSTSMYVMVDSATAANRRIERVTKSGNGSRQSFYNASTFTGALRNLYINAALDLILARTTGIEYIDSNATRIGAPFSNPSAAPCTTSNTGVVKTFPLANGKIVFLHAAASQNRIGILPTGGGTTCQTIQAAPNANSFPSAGFYDATNNKLIVAYAGNATTTDLNSIYAYTINETTGAFTSPQKLYDAANFPGTVAHLLYGISDMVYDQERGHVYIATAISSATTVVNYKIERFIYTPAKIGTDNNNVLVLEGAVPFYNYGNDTKCVSSMFVGD